MTSIAVPCYTYNLLGPPRKPECAPGQEFAVFFHLRDLDVRAVRFDVEIAPGVIDFQLGAKDKDTNLHQAGPLVTKGRAELVMGSLGEIRAAGHLAVEME